MSAGQMRSNNSRSWIVWSKIDGLGSEMSESMRRGAVSQVLAGPTVRTM